MEEGTVSVRVFTSRAQIPIENAAVAFTRDAAAGRGELLAVRFTDESGRVPPLPFAAPDAAQSRAPESGQPFAQINAEVWHPGYVSALVEHIQVFAGQQTLQYFDLIPLEEYPEAYSETAVFDLPAQAL